MQDIILRSVSTGVYVLTAQHQGRANGSTVAWVSQVSFDPMLMMVSLANIRYSFDLVKKSGYFGLNVLGADQVETARHFGYKTAHETDKMEGLSYGTSEKGLPILDGVKAYIECRVVESFPAGDHTLFVGEVVAAESLKDDAQPLIFKQEDFF